ncbi:MAG TPA: hypothetical protein VH482_03640, partial [Thermomicrobiales bacterium]
MSGVESPTVADPPETNAPARHGRVAIEELHLAPDEPAPAEAATAVDLEAVRRRIGAHAEEDSWWERWRLTVAAAACWGLLVAGFVLDHLTAAPHAAVVVLYAGAYLAGGTFATRKAVGDLVHGRVNVDLLMVTAAVGAAGVGAWAEGAVLLALFSTSNALEHHALGRTRRAVRALMELS